MALGAPAPGATIPAIYIYGTIASGGFEGVYRSDDGGNTWLQLNTTSQQWGGLIQTVAADPNVFGRVYLGINGRGIIMGNPTSSLPANWVDTDINDPGNPGLATSSTTLSSGTVVNQWNIAGGGVGLAATPVSISSLSVSGNVATAVSTAADGFQVGEMVTISGASNSVYDGTFVITGLANTAAGIASEIGGATEFTFNLVTANGTATGTITATLADQFNFAYQPVTGDNYFLGPVAKPDQCRQRRWNSLGRRHDPRRHQRRRSVLRDGANIRRRSRPRISHDHRRQRDDAIARRRSPLDPNMSRSSVAATISVDSTVLTARAGRNLAPRSPSPQCPQPPTSGLVATASYNPQLTDAVFADVSNGFRSHRRHRRRSRLPIPSREHQRP